MSLDARIDELYQLPLAEFTAARNALAKTLAGDDRARVKTLEKPAVVPWAINQVYWRDRRAYDRLMKSGAALRAAQIAALEGRKADVRQAGAAHRQALADAVSRAIALAGEHGAKPGAEPLARMLETVSIAPEPLAPPGRLTDVVQPAGFAALTGVTPRPAPPPAAGAAKKKTSSGDAGPRAAAQPARRPPVEVDFAAERRAEAERKARDARLAAAERILERARAAESQARRALARAEAEVRAAEATLDRIKLDRN